MTTQEIITQLQSLTIDNSEDYEKLEQINTLVDQLRENRDGQLACDALINLLERHPSIEFGTPGEPIHTIECYPGQYEELLNKSLDRRPTYMTIWMLNRIINASPDNKADLIAKMKEYTFHPLADNEAKTAAKEFYDFQTKE